MNSILKTSLIAFGVAAVTSTASVLAFDSKTDKGTQSPAFTETGALYTVANTPIQEPSDFVNAAESTVNGVVSIKSFATQRGSNSYYGNQSPFNDPFFEFFFGGNGRRAPQQRQQQAEPQERPMGLGSGVILNTEGYIVTNNHVIDGSDRLEVTLNDNRTFNATVIGKDPTTDLALIKIEADGLHVIPMGDSEAVRVGEWVLAVGNPFGFTSTVTKGIVSAKARNISQRSPRPNGSNGIESYIQTDAAVNPGNSGGALVNLNGELIGINTAIYSETGNFAGYSFAIPTSIVKKVVTDLKQYGTVQRAVLGVSYNELTADLVKEKNVTAVSAGILVREVVENSGAADAGIRENDVITEIDGMPAHNTAQLQEAIAKHRPGDKVKVTFYRDNKKQEVNVMLRNQRGNTEVTRSADFAELGCAFKSVPAETLRQLRLRSGVQVTGLKEGRFKAAGIKDGFIIQDINNSRVNSRDDVEKIYNAIMSDESGYDKVMFITGCYPTGRKVYYAVDLEAK